MNHLRSSLIFRSTRMTTIPYLIMISDPRPNWEIEQVKGYGVNVDQVLPIPLSGAEALDFDFDTVYQHTFQVRRLSTLIDYAHEPVRFSTYSAAHRAIIRQRMADIALRGGNYLSGG